MSVTLDFNGLVAVLRAGAARVKAGTDELGLLDSAIGDGDHGVAMGRAMDALLKGIDQCQSEDIKALLQGVAWAVLSIDAGSTGPLLGSLFMGMVQPFGEAATVDSTRLAAMLDAGLAELRAISKAAVGDKTMMDALVPAVEALNEAATGGATVAVALDRASAAAERGAESTKDLQAQFGKARNLGARSIGHQDPGATSMAMLLRGFAEGAAAIKPPH